MAYESFAGYLKLENTFFIVRIFLEDNNDLRIQDFLINP